MSYRWLRRGAFLLGLFVAAGIPGRALAVPYFNEDAGALGTQNQCNPAGCWTNYLRVTDIDADADLDILFVNYSGYFQVGSPQPLVVYLNDGTGTFTDGSASTVNGFSGRLRQVAVGDVDLDGDADIFAPDGTGNADALFINDGSGSFTDEADARIGSSSHAGATRFGDFDADGDLDLFVADGFIQGGGAGAYAHIYLNDGTGMFQEADGAVPSVAVVNMIDVDLLDADRDFDLDILVNPHMSTDGLWINDGTGNFTVASGAIPSPAGGGPLHYGPGVCDVDGDGDLDIWIDNTGPNYTEQLLINDGTGKYSDVTSAQVSGNPGADDNGVVCADIDNDGDFDAVVVSLSDQERVLVNDGSGNFSLFPNAFQALSDPTLWGEFGDLDGDGRFDFVTGQGEDSPQLNRVYLAVTDVPVDDRAPTIITVESVDGPVDAGVQPVVRFAVSDRDVSDEGARLDRAWVEISGNDVDAAFMGGDLYRAVLPETIAGDGMVTYRACARDRQGNEACGDDMSFDVNGGGMDTTGGASSSGGAEGSGTGSSASGTGSASASASASASGGSASASGSGTAGTGGGTDTEGPGESGGSGCGCRGRGDRGSTADLILVLGLLGVFRGRHRVRDSC